MNKLLSAVLVTVLALGALALSACDDDTPPPGDMAMSSTEDLSEPTCSQLCQEFAVCFEAANPGFVGSTMALVPCENTCFSMTDQQRNDLRTCSEQDCSAFLVCAASAGLKLMPKAMMDMAAHD
jgi:hypothetical protein